MTCKGKEHSRRLERLIKFVNKEQEAGRLSEEQVKIIAQASLKPLEEQENSLAYFMIGGGIAEEVARRCCVILVEQLAKFLPNDRHALKLIESMKPAGRPQQKGE